MQAILYVAHGTRVREGEQQARQFIEKVQKKIPVGIQEISFLEISAPSVEQGVVTCVGRGATEIIVMPLLLLAAQHAKSDLPEILKRVRVTYPHIIFRLGTPIGINRTMIDAVVEQLATVHFPHKAQIILIGRGSSDPDIQRDFAEIASRVKLRTALRNIEIAFLYGAGPQLSDVIEQNLDREDQLILVPYLLFTGLLNKGLLKIQEQSLREVEITPLLGEMTHAMQGFEENILQNLRHLSIKEVV
ncbi:MAG: sirohydrochlorin chelatase [Kurthia sp.]|nr:sirohydrochlorin chelatase [Candidatus Kurthia equi]